MLAIRCLTASLLIIVTITAVAMPAPITSIQSPSFLANGFDLTAYRACQQQLNHCPAYQQANHVSCIQHALSDHAVCQQTKQLADFLTVSAAQLNVAAFGQFQQLIVCFPGDGQTRYYLIAPNGQLLNTINPKQLKRSDLPADLQPAYPKSLK